MGVFGSIYRYIVTLGGLIGGDIDAATDRMLATPGGVKTTFQKTREQWTKQYAEVREAVAKLMMVLEQKKHQVDRLQKEAAEVKTKMKGAVRQFKEKGDATYQTAFSELHARDQQLTAEQEGLQGEIKELQGKVGQYKAKLEEMQKRIQELKQQEASAIADIVSSQQIIKLNDRLSNVSTELDDRNLQAIEDRRQNLRAQATLSGELGTVEKPDLDKELLAAGTSSEADDLFAAMLAEESGQTEEPETATEKQSAREL